MKNFIFCLFLLLGGYLTYGQEITGKVVDEIGDPIPEVYITAATSNTSTVTDIDGNFTIQAAPGEMLTFSMVSYENVTMEAASGMSVTMKASASSTLEEVVIIGYGTQRKADVTGSISVVSSKDLENKPNANALSSVQGKVPGVVVNNSGAPGAAPSVSIRGLGSISNSDPLYVVDGVITNDITYLNPADIQNISILKDASSSAIYGIRAANGVIIITTKTGRKTGVENINFSYDANIGFTVPTNVLGLANAEDYIRLYNEKLDYEGNTDPSARITAADFNNTHTDWYDEILKKNSLTQAHNLSVTGASEKTTYSMGLGYFSQDGILDAGKGYNSGNDYERITARFNGTYNITDDFRMGVNMAYYNYNRNDVRLPFYQARVAPPVLAAFGPDGNYGTLPLSPDLGTFANPRATLDFFRGKAKGNRILLSGFAEYDIIEGLTFKTNYSVDDWNENSFEYTPEYFVSNTQKSDQSLLTNRNDTKQSILWENTLTWTKEFGKHRVVVLGGYSIQQNRGRSLRAAANDVPFNGDDSTLFLNLGVGTPAAAFDAGQEGYKDRFQSYFGRVQYAFDDKYLINATVRRDGASAYNFEGNQKSATFPSIGAGWVISEESFMENAGFDLLKIKGSWGKLGNASISRQYDLAATVQNPAFLGAPSSAQNAVSITQLVDPSINWEIVEEYDLGIELRTIQNKLSFEANYYNRETTDAVFAIQIPSQAGLGTSFVTNAGSFRNKGFEVSAIWDDKIGDFSYSVYGNFTTIDNEITQVLGGSFLNTGPGIFGNPVKRWEVGQEIGSYYGYQVEGVVQTEEEAAEYGSPVGSLKFADLDGNGVIDEDDKTFLGSPVPDLTYGFGFTLGYANIDFGMDFQGVAGNEIYNFNRNVRFGNENWDQDFVDNRWTADNPSNTYPAPNSDQQSSRPSSFYVEKGDYFRIRTITLGYTIPQTFMDKSGIDRLRFYISAQNPWTSFDYNGFSPELGKQQDIANMGLDNNVYPLSAVYSFGINLNF